MIKKNPTKLSFSDIMEDLKLTLFMDIFLNFMKCPFFPPPLFPIFHYQHFFKDIYYMCLFCLVLPPFFIPPCNHH